MFIGFKVDKPKEFYNMIQEWNAKVSMVGNFLSPTRYVQVKDEYFGVKITPLVPKEMFIIGIVLSFIASLIFGANMISTIFMIVFGLLLSLHTPLPYIAGVKMRIKREKKDMMIEYVSNSRILEKLMEGE